MPTFAYRKLVRDKVYDITIEGGNTAVVKPLSPEEWIQALKDKMVEEAAEVKSATTAEELTEELADVLEVIHGFCAARGVAFDQVEKARQTKNQKRGGLKKGLYIEQATFPEGHRLTKYCRARPEKYPEIG